mgnify:CR=1 FL=1
MLYESANLVLEFSALVLGRFFLTALLLVALIWLMYKFLKKPKAPMVVLLIFFCCYVISFLPID